jgi:ABC-type anion transport system duplicated permease subunit
VEQARAATHDNTARVPQHDKKGWCLATRRISCNLRRVLKRLCGTYSTAKANRERTYGARSSRMRGSRRTVAACDGFVDVEGWATWAPCIAHALDHRVKPDVIHSTARLRNIQVVFVTVIISVISSVIQQMSTSQVSVTRCSRALGTTSIAFAPSSCQPA